MQKTVWITSLTKDEKKAAALFQKVHSYGLAKNGHFWIDDLDKMAWSGAAEQLLDPATAAWLVVGAAEDFAKDSVRRGLSLLALLVAGQRGHGFPTVVCPFSGAVDAAGLPTPLLGAQAVAEAMLGAKLAALANLPRPPEDAGYRLKLYPLPGMGLWFECGPGPAATWQGALFGVAGATIDAHGVGPSGKLPERAVLNYPFKDMRLAAGDKEYVAWGLSNALGPDASYYVRVVGSPEGLVFGELPTADAADLYTVRLT